MKMRTQAIIYLLVITVSFAYGSLLHGIVTYLINPFPVTKNTDAPIVPLSFLPSPDASIPTLSFDILLTLGNVSSSSLSESQITSLDLEVCHSAGIPAGSLAHTQSEINGFLSFFSQNSEIVVSAKRFLRGTTELQQQFLVLLLLKDYPDYASTPTLLFTDITNRLTSSKSSLENNIRQNNPELHYWTVADIQTSNMKVSTNNNNDDNQHDQGTSSSSKKEENFFVKFFKGNTLRIILVGVIPGVALFVLVLYLIYCCSASRRNANGSKELELLARINNSRRRRMNNYKPMKTVHFNSALNTTSSTPQGSTPRNLPDNLPRYTLTTTERDFLSIEEQIQSADEDFGPIVLPSALLQFSDLISSGNSNTSSSNNSNTSPNNYSYYGNFNNNCNDPKSEYRQFVNAVKNKNRVVRY
jgi:hypothetical protein